MPSGGRAVDRNATSKTKFVSVADFSMMALMPMLSAAKSCAFVPQAKAYLLRTSAPLVFTALHALST